MPACIWTNPKASRHLYKILYYTNYQLGHQLSKRGLLFDSTLQVYHMRFAYILGDTWRQSVIDQCQKCLCFTRTYQHIGCTARLCVGCCFMLFGSEEPCPLCGQTLGELPVNLTHSISHIAYCTVN